MASGHDFGASLYTDEDVFVVQVSANDPRFCPTEAIVINGEPTGARQPEAEISPGPTLPAELATWSIVARRQGTDPHSGARDLRRIALTQRGALHATAALAHAAVHRGEIPREAGPHLQSRIVAAAESWAGMAEQWSWGLGDVRPGIYRSQRWRVADTVRRHRHRPAQ